MKLNMVQFLCLVIEFTRLLFRSNVHKIFRNCQSKNRILSLGYQCLCGAMDRKRNMIWMPGNISNTVRQRKDKLFILLW